MKVRFAESAAAAYDDALTRIQGVNPFAAVRFADAVRQALRRISRFPRAGYAVAEFPSSPIRQFLVEPYRFFYFIDERTKSVLIVDVWHGAQLPAEPRLPQPGAGR